MSTKDLTIRFGSVVGLLAGLSACAGCEAINEQALQSLLGSGIPFTDPNATDNATSGVASAEPASIYDVDLAGYAAGETGGTFNRQATITVCDNVDSATSGNVVEVIIESGTPLTSSKIGAFLFATHSSLYEAVPSNTPTDLAFVSLDEQAGNITLIPDADARVMANSLNTFTTGQGNIQDVYRVDEGLIVLEFREDDSIGGFIEVQGTGIFDAGEGAYTATFRGWLRGSEPDEGTDQGTG